MATTGSGKTQSDKRGRKEKARGHVKTMKAKADKVINAFKSNATSNLEALNDLANGMLADDEDHSLGATASELLTTWVVSWGSAVELGEELLDTWLPESSQRTGGSRSRS